MQMDVYKHSCTLNHRKMVEAERSRLIPRKRTDNLVLLTGCSQNALPRVLLFTEVLAVNETTNYD